MMRRAMLPFPFALAWWRSTGSPDGVKSALAYDAAGATGKLVRKSHRRRGTARAAALGEQAAIDGYARARVKTQTLARHVALVLGDTVDARSPRLLHVLLVTLLGVSGLLVEPAFRVGASGSQIGGLLEWLEVNVSVAKSQILAWGSMGIASVLGAGGARALQHALGFRKLERDGGMRAQEIVPSGMPRWAWVMTAALAFVVLAGVAVGVTTMRGEALQLSSAARASTGSSTGIVQGVAPTLSHWPASTLVVGEMVAALILTLIVSPLAARELHRSEAREGRAKRRLRLALWWNGNIQARATAPGVHQKVLVLRLYADLAGSAGETLNPVAIPNVGPLPALSDEPRLPRPGPKAQTFVPNDDAVQREAGRISRWAEAIDTHDAARVTSGAQRPSPEASGDENGGGHGAGR